MKLQLTLLLVAALIASTYFVLPGGAKSEIEIEFAKFKQVFDRDYSKSEETYRFAIFKENVEKINKHNADNTQTYKMGITQFADMTQEEFVAKVLTPLDKLTTVKPAIVLANTYEPIPNAVDWRTAGAVTGVKNQGQCGSCWAFSTTGVLESVTKVKKGSLPNYSEQQLVDCCGKKGFQCQGCNGAWPEWALNYINSAGIVSESSYPYKGVEGACQTASGEKVLNPSKPWTMLGAGDTAALKTAVGASPVSICVDAANWSLYKSGVFSNCKATQSALDHAVLLVGYEDSGNWIVKNSWSTSWGEQGYIRLAPGNTCGLALHAVIPNLA